MPMRLSQRHRADLHVPLGVPLRQKDDGGAGGAHGKEPRVNEVVFRPGRVHGAGEGEDAPAVRRVFGRMQDVVVGGAGGEPLVAVSQGAIDPGIEKIAGRGIVRPPADVFESPCKWEDAPVVVHGPAAVLVAADALFKPTHDGETIEYNRGEYSRGAERVNSAATFCRRPATGADEPARRTCAIC